MATKLKNHKIAPNHDVVAVSKDETMTAKEVVEEITTLVIPMINSEERLDFKKLKELGKLIEHHHDELTHITEKEKTNAILKKITALNMTRLTEELNDVEKSQAAMLIRYIIKNHPHLEKIDLKHNTFSPPDLQFIITALLHLKHDVNKKNLLQVIILNNSIHTDNVESSGLDLRKLKKLFGNVITMDNLVYQYFLEKYKTACNNYLTYLAEKVIIPKSQTEHTGDPLQTTDKIASDWVAKNKPPESKAEIKFASAIKKFQLIRGLQKTLAEGSEPQKTFEQFEKHYATIKKQIPDALTKDEGDHEQRLHDHVGDIKVEKFIPASQKPHSIFKAEPKKKNKKSKTKSKTKNRSV